MAVNGGKFMDKVYMQDWRSYCWWDRWVGRNKKRYGNYKRKWLEQRIDFKQLYQHFDFKKEREVPEEYEIRSRYNRVKGKMQRVYSLIKVV